MKNWFLRILGVLYIWYDIIDDKKWKYKKIFFNGQFFFKKNLYLRKYMCLFSKIFFHMTPFYDIKIDNRCMFPMFFIYLHHFKGRYVPISMKNSEFQNIFNIFIILVFLRKIRYKKNNGQKSCFWERNEFGNNVYFTEMCGYGGVRHDFKVEKGIFFSDF